MYFYCIYVLYVCMYCMYACEYVCMYVFIYIQISVGVIDVGFRSHPRIDGKVCCQPEGALLDDDGSCHGLHVLSIIGAAEEKDCPIKGIAQNVTFFTYTQSVAGGVDFHAKLENAEVLDNISKDVCILLMLYVCIYV